MHQQAAKKAQKCACCGVAIPPDANYRQGGKDFCGKRCQEFEALTQTAKVAGDAFAWDVVA